MVCGVFEHPKVFSNIKIFFSAQVMFFEHPDFSTPTVCAIPDEEMCVSLQRGAQKRMDLPENLERPSLEKKCVLLQFGEIDHTICTTRSTDTKSILRFATV